MYSPEQHEYTHLAFTDEKDYNRGRYRGVALVSLSREDYDEITGDLLALLSDSDVREFGWKKLTSAKYQFAADKLVRYAISKMVARKLRVDVLIWDSQDERHSVPVPDDIGNLHFMYFHLFRNVVRLRYPPDATWLLHPDEHTAIDWVNIDDRLQRRSIIIDDDLPLFPSPHTVDRLRQQYSIVGIEEVRSIDEPLVQLADLFVGLGCFSRNSYQEYASWQVENSAQMQLFPAEVPTKLSSSAKHRCPVICLLDQLCKEHRFGVSLRTHMGFRTLNPDGPINFWWYEAQHENDKAKSRKGA